MTFLTTLNFRLETYGAQAGKFTVSGSFYADGQNLHTFKPRETDYAPICVSSTRHPQDIARDIERRLLPQFYKCFDTALETKRKHDARTRKVNELAQAVCDASSGAFTMYENTMNTPYPEIGLYAGGGDMHARAKIYEESITFDSLSVPHDLAIEIAKLICAKLKRKPKVKRALPARKPDLRARRKAATR
jgi:hypothetical protein